MSNMIPLFVIGIIVVAVVLVSILLARIISRYDNTLPEADLTNVFPLGRSGYARTGQQNKTLLTLVKTIETEMNLQKSDAPTSVVVEDEQGMMMLYGEDNR